MDSSNLTPLEFLKYLSGRKNWSAATFKKSVANYLAKNSCETCRECPQKQPLEPEELEHDPTLGDYINDFFSKEWLKKHKKTLDGIQKITKNIATKLDKLNTK